MATKILHVYKDYYPVLGGMENHIKMLAEALVQTIRVTADKIALLRPHLATITDKELAILRKGERQIREGDFVWWRDVKRTDV